MRTRDSGFRAKPVILWIDWAGCASALANEQAIRDFCRTARAAGVTHVASELPAVNAAQNAAFMQVAENERLVTGYVMPMFMAGDDTTSSTLESYAVWNGNAYEVVSSDGRDGIPARLSPAVEANRKRAISDIRTAATDSKCQFLILSDFGFSKSSADISEEARRAFAAWSGFAIRNWPEEVLGKGPPPETFGALHRGRYWQPWQTWRADLLKKFLIDIDAELNTVPGGAPKLAIMADAPFPAVERLGFNWAARNGMTRTDYPWIGPEFEATGAGYLADAIVLGFWRPEFATTGDAAAAGFAWWASIEGASAGAARYLSGTPRWAAIPIARSERWPKAARSAVLLNDGLMLISASEFIAEPRRWQDLQDALVARPQ